MGFAKLRRNYGGGCLNASPAAWRRRANRGPAWRSPATAATPTRGATGRYERRADRRRPAAAS
eukprot:7274854-Lingulodinium_polyedra.AAC.1